MRIDVRDLILKSFRMKTKTTKMNEGETLIEVKLSTKKTLVYLLKGLSEFQARYVTMQIVINNVRPKIKYHNLRHKCTDTQTDTATDTHTVAQMHAYRYTDAQALTHKWQTQRGTQHTHIMLHRHTYTESHRATDTKLHVHTRLSTGMHIVFQLWHQTILTNP